jgi:hypothetical protein
LIEFGQLVLEKKIFKIFRAFLLFRSYLPLEKSDPLHLNKFETPLPKDDMCQVWLKWRSGSGEEVEKVKVYRQTVRRTARRTMDNR